MEERTDRFRLNGMVYRAHIIMYVVAVLFLCQMIWTSVGKWSGDLWIAVIFIGVFLVMILAETTLFGLAMKQWPLYERAYFIYKIFQVVALFVFCESIDFLTSYGMGYIFFFLGIIELIMLIQFEEFFQRMLFYFLVLLPIGIVSIVRIFYISGTLSERFRQLLVTFLFIWLIIFISESLARIWRFFYGQIMTQHRMMDRLNDANGELKDNQEKINKVNELLGMQKVQLQAANGRIKRAHEEMVLQNEIANIISTSLDIGKLSHSVAELIQDKLGMDFVGVIVKTERDGQLVSFVTSMGKAMQRKIESGFLSGEHTGLLRHRNTYVENQAKWDLFLGGNDEKYMGSLIVVPLKKNRKNIGSLIVGKSEPKVFADNREFYETIAGQVSIGVTNAMLYDQMKEMAIRDGLTGVYNRRYLTELIHEFLNEAIKNKTSVSIALFDIDKFKVVNDTYGHMFGDVVIRHVAKLLNDKAQENQGIVGRYGGEEFVIVFPGKSIAETYLLVKDVHEQIRSTQLDKEGIPVDVRVSVGISSYPETGQNPSEVLTRADWSMYHSKRNGRDQITIDSQEIATEME